jgi:Leucine-rich repeat (LRR) protein
MCGNQLTSLDPGIGELKNLKELDLSSNQITTLPSSFTLLTSLVNLNLGKAHEVNAPA